MCILVANGDGRKQERSELSRRQHEWLRRRWIAQMVWRRHACIRSGPGRCFICIAHIFCMFYHAIQSVSKCIGCVSVQIIMCFYMFLQHSFSLQSHNVIKHMETDVTCVFWTPLCFPTFQPQKTCQNVAKHTEFSLGVKNGKWRKNPTPLKQYSQTHKYLLVVEFSVMHYPESILVPSIPKFLASLLTYS